MRKVCKWLVLEFTAGSCGKHRSPMGPWKRVKNIGLTVGVRVTSDGGGGIYPLPFPASFPSMFLLEPSHHKVRKPRLRGELSACGCSGGVSCLTAGVKCHACEWILHLVIPAPGLQATPADTEDRHGVFWSWPTLLMYEFEKKEGEEQDEASATGSGVVYFTAKDR